MAINPNERRLDKLADRRNPLTATAEPMALAGSRTTEKLAWTQIRRDGGTQMRAGLNRETVGEYADTMRRQDAYEPFPPVVVFYDGENYFLGDGFHRHQAAFEAWGSNVEIPVEVRSGTRRDAVLFACSVNANHGLRRSQSDKERSVDTLLQDEEWKGWSDREIARRCSVSHPFVAGRRAKLPSTSSGVDGAAVGELVEPTAERKYTDRYGHERTMNTASIGNGQAKLIVLTAEQTRLHILDALKRSSTALASGSDTEQRLHQLKTHSYMGAYQHTLPKGMSIDPMIFAVVHTALLNEFTERAATAQNAHNSSETGVLRANTHADGQTHEIEPIASVEQSDTSERVIAETLDEAIRRAVCVYAGNREKWEALVATGADYAAISDQLKQCITSYSGCSGPGIYSIERYKGPQIKIFTDIEGAPIQALSGRLLVDAVRKAWGIPESTGAQSQANGTPVYNQATLEKLISDIILYEAGGNFDKAHHLALLVDHKDAAWYVKKWGSEFTWAPGVFMAAHSAVIRRWRSENTQPDTALPIYTQAQIEKVIELVISKRAAAAYRTDKAALVNIHKNIIDPERWMDEAGERFTWKQESGMSDFLAAYCAVGNRLAAMPNVTGNVTSDPEPDTVVYDMNAIALHNKITSLLSVIADYGTLTGFHMQATAAAQMLQQMALELDGVIGQEKPLPVF